MTNDSSKRSYIVPDMKIYEVRSDERIAHGCVFELYDPMDSPWSDGCVLKKQKRPIFFGS